MVVEQSGQEAVNFGYLAQPSAPVQADPEPDYALWTVRPCSS